MEDEREREDNERFYEDYDVDMESDAELTEKIAELKDRIAENLYDYPAYVELIKILRQLGELNELSAYRRSLQSLCPLNEEIWREWLEDEKNLVSSDRDKLRVLELYKTALKDYLSVDLWIDYLKYLSSVASDQLQIEIERGLSACCWDLSNGQKLWVFLINSGLIDKENALKRILKLPYSRKAREEMKEALQMNIDGDATFDSLEEKITKSTESVDFYEYLNHIQSNDCKLAAANKTSLSRVIYERIICKLGADANVWMEYLKFLQKSLDLGSVVLPVSERAVRFCPWSSYLWQRHFLNLERFGASGSIKEAYEKATAFCQELEDFINLSLGYLDSIRRSATIEESIKLVTFQDIVNQEESRFGAGSDSYCRLNKYFIKVLIDYGKIEKAQSIWETSIIKYHAKEVAYWLEYVQFEEKTNEDSFEKCQGLFKRAVAAVTDAPEALFYQWLQFVKQNGSLEDLLEAERRIESQRNILKEREAKASEKKSKTMTAGKKRTKLDVQQEELVKVKEEKKEERKERFNPKATVFLNNLSYETGEPEIRQFIESILKENKKVFKSDSHVVSIKMHRKPTGQFKGYANVELNDEGAARIIFEKFDRSRMAGRPIFFSAYSAPSQEKSNESKKEYPRGRDPLTVYISNLPEGVDKQALTEMFAGCGKVKDVRLVENKAGRFRGCAYVQFESEKSANEAVKAFDGKEIQGSKEKRTIHVSISDPSLAKKPREDHKEHKTERLKLSLKPRMLLANKQPEPVGEVEPSEGGLSNEDFRRKLGLS